MEPASEGCAAANGQCRGDTNGSPRPPGPSHQLDDIATPSDLKFDEEWSWEGSQDAELLAKRQELQRLLLEPDAVSLDQWRAHTVSKGGLLSDAFRRVVWPRLLGVLPEELVDGPPLETLQQHPEYQQVQLDVARSLKRFPPGVPLERRLALQDELAALILRVMTARPALCYYQGYHDVAVTLLLVVGSRAACPLLARLSDHALRPYLAADMGPAQRLLRLVPALAARVRPALAARLQQAGAGTMFALPWVLTWFGHSLPRYRDVVRLYDAFLPHHPLLPLYVTAAILLHREQEIMECEVDMAAMHCLLSRLPDGLPWDGLLERALELLARWPPAALEEDVARAERQEEAARRGEERQRARARGGAAVARGGWVARGGGWRALAAAAVVLAAALYWRGAASVLLPR